MKNVTSLFPGNLWQKTTTGRQFTTKDITLQSRGHRKLCAKFNVVSPLSAHLLSTKFTTGGSR